MPWPKVDPEESFPFKMAAALCSPMTSSLFPPSPAPAPSPPPATLAGVFPQTPKPSGATPRSLVAVVRVAFEAKCSDVHLGVGEEPRLRFRGDMQMTDWPITTGEQFTGWLEEILAPGDRQAFQDEKEYDGSHAFSFVRVRINLFESLLGPAMVLRLIPFEVPTLEDLDLPEVFKSLLNYTKGLILMTGPTGCGKTTTLAAMINWMNITQTKHILTIEDPVEFVHPNKSCLVHQREIGHHTKMFSIALRAALREDPDVLLIGEIRDHETLSTALEAAQTGHLVFGTLHTNSAVKTVERILGMFPAEDQKLIRANVAESLLAVISQGLLKSTDGGRVAYHDIFINTDACRDYLLRSEFDQVEEIMKRSSFEGMQTLNQSLLELVTRGKVSEEDALAVSLKRGELSQALRGRE
jgi:twitching motility protein PilT